MQNLERIVYLKSQLSMISQNLFEEVLIKPVMEGANELNIISGYATASMASRHLEQITKLSENIKIKLVVGMTLKDGIAMGNHSGFLSIKQSDKFKNNFSCQYIFQNAPVHTKMFLWNKSSNFHKAFIGSANYSRIAFSKSQRELMQSSNSNELQSYFDSIEKDSIDIEHPELEENIRIWSDKNYWANHHFEDSEMPEYEFNDKLESLSHCRISLLSKQLGYEVQNQAGLNWGQRPERANKNEAYIQLPPNVYKTDFFPSKPNQFLVRTDDNKSLICVRTFKG